MYDLRCDKCGWNETMDSVIYTNCPNCNHPLIIEDYNDEDIPNIIGHEHQSFHNNNIILPKIGRFIILHDKDFIIEKNGKWYI